MRVLVVSNLYPPVAFGGYEVECSGVVEHLRERHEVLVLTGDAAPRGASAGGVEPELPGGDGGGIRRELPLLTPDPRGAARAPAASLRAVRAARRALAWRPGPLSAAVVAGTRLRVGRGVRHLRTLRWVTLPHCRPHD